MSIPKNETGTDQNDDENDIDDDHGTNHEHHQEGRLEGCHSNISNSTSKEETECSCSIVTTNTPMTVASSTTLTSASTILTTAEPAEHHDEPTRTKRDESSSVQVAVRIRPCLAKEAGSDICIRVLPPVHDPKQQQQKGSTRATTTALAVPRALQIGGSQGPCFTFDQVFAERTQQEELYQARVQPLVDSCLQGYNATIFAYGQTGSGKTFTIMGDYSTTAPLSNCPDAGVIPRALHALFQGLSPRASVRIQFLELYGEEIRDLLASNTSTSSSTSGTTARTEGRLQFPHLHHHRRRHGSANHHSNKLTIREVDDEPEVVGATQRVVSNAQEALVALTHGMLRRVTAATAMNASSSRSHAILSVLIEQPIHDANTENGRAGNSAADFDEDDEYDEEENGNSNDGEDEDDDCSPAGGVKTSKFHFVDLAGSERQKRTNAEGKRLKEGIDINKGLLVLGNVISALGDPRKQGSFVPYRDSKLTRLLKGSLGGNHKTLMIACVSPSSDNLDESLNCLRYANRARNIQNNATVNVDSTSRLVSELKRQVQILATELLQAWDDPDKAKRKEKTMLTRDMVVALAAGMTVSSEAHNHITSSAKKLVTPTSSSSPFLLNREHESAATAAATARAMELEIELSRTRDALRDSMANHDAAEEQLYVAKAEKELYQMHLSVLNQTANHDGDAAAGGVTIDMSDQLQAAFLEKSREYEAEIGQLQAQLREAQTKAKRMDWFTTQLSPSNDAGRNIFDDDSVLISRARQALEDDRVRLTSIEENLTFAPTDPFTPQMTGVEDDYEEQAELARLNDLTRKYLGEKDDSFDHDDDDGKPRDDENQDKVAVPPPDQRHLRADLIELSRSIAAKEDLIDQLQMNQEKYAVRAVNDVLVK